MRSSVFGRGPAYSHLNNNRHLENSNADKISPSGYVTDHNNPLSGAHRAVLQTQDDVHRENEAILSALGNNVLQMKTVAGRLSAEAHEQNTLLNTLRTSVETARGGIGHSVDGIRNVFRTYGNRDALKMAVVALIVLLIFYFLLRSFIKEVRRNEE